MVVGRHFSPVGRARWGGRPGRADAGVLAGSDYTRAGGFWAGGVVAPLPEYGIYLPLVVRGG